jgi:thioesterase domain-containing protein
VSVAAFLSQLHRLDVHVWVEGDRLRCSARSGALTAELREQLRERRDDIVSFLRLADSVAAQQRCIVPLQPNGGKPPIFGVPGAGDVFCFRALAQSLGPEQPFFGLQPPGADGRSAPLTRVEELAAYFAEQIQALRPRGPWIIAGKCIGGTVAYELARQLATGGSPVAFLAFFGVPYPTFFNGLNLLRHRIENRAGRVRDRVRLLGAQSAKERLEYFRWRIRLGNAAADPATALHDKVVAAMVTAVRAYEPRPFPVRIHHFVPCEAWAKRPLIQAERWRAFGALVESYPGPHGCTEEEMLLDPYARLFAQHFRATCSRAGL